MSAVLAAAVVGADPARPAEVDLGAWRRLSRLGRLAAAVAAPMVATLEARRPGASRSLPLLWAPAIGEFGSTVAFLRTLQQRGPAGASPLHFQTSVHNAAAGQISIALGLQGPSDTVVAGTETAARVLQLALLRLARADAPPAILVLAADALGDETLAGLPGTPLQPPFAEGAAALLIGQGPGRLVLAPGGPAVVPGLPFVGLAAVAALFPAGGKAAVGGGFEAEVLP